MAAFFSLFGVLCAQALLETARDTLFLTRIPVARLPWVNLTLALLTLVAGASSPAIARWHDRWRGAPARRSASSPSPALIIGAVITGALGVALADGHRAWVYALFLWSGMFSALSVTKIWAVLAETLDMTRAKRLYGRLAAGGGLGAVVGAALARALGHCAPPHALVLLAAIIVVLTALGPALGLARTRHAGGGGAGADAPSGIQELARTVRHPYVGRLLLTTVLATAVATLLDFAFKEAVAARLPSARLPVFLASFHLTTSVLSLLAQLFGLAVVVRVAGVRRAPLILPGLLLAGLVAAVFSAGLAPLILLRGLDGALRNSFHRPSSELLQVPLPDGLRRRAKPLIDVLGLRGGQAGAAAILLLMIAAAAGPAIRAVVLAGLLVAWALVARGLGRRYVDLLRSTLIRPGAVVAASREAPPVDGEPLGAIHGREALDAVVERLSRRESRAAAQAALARTAGAFEVVQAVLADPARPVGLRANAPRALVEIDAPRSVGPLLEGLLVERDGFVRYRILRALDRVRRARPGTPLDEDILGRAALAAVASAYRYLAWRLFLEDGVGRAPERRTPTSDLLRDLLAEKEENAVERLFRVLALRYPREDFRRLLRGLRSGEVRARAASRELIENLLTGPARALTLALVDEAGDRQRLLAMAGGRPPRAPTYHRLLATLRDEEDGGMLGALAARHARELGEAVPRAPAAAPATCPAVARA